MYTLRAQMKIKTWKSEWICATEDCCNRCRIKLYLLRPRVFFAEFWVLHLESLTVFTRSFLHPQRPDHFLLLYAGHFVIIIAIVPGKVCEDQCVALVPSSGGMSGERFKWMCQTHHPSWGFPGLNPSPALLVPSLLLQSYPLSSTRSRSYYRICRKEKKLFEVGAKPIRAVLGLWGKKMQSW